ncbi:MAG: aconitate hydratase [Gammaproteobacteria bacterium CG_4_10_14_0_8_um_filter_38_16]|nr:MAG: aconitate hydratase [Gammaproteobacteria bacterium CG_4_10_14_0_8_um_filter_38_16]PJA03418.1 MAG: aconitate hydratase [Gammaproteobacteria bacterium CG_4_10_14_0_2_um_filter_38_22]PJB09881.1 MAG: aconitate hydratase [Gammaproteobacteria bacterium CG_4_9_14_3_um_filter_38_9]
MNISQKLIHTHLIEGKMIPGEEIAIQMDQTLSQDATGTLVMLELESMELDYRKTELSVQYVDHNLIQEDYKNPDDHLFLQSAAARFGLHFSQAGNGVSHPVHMQYFGRPGITMAGSDSHTPAAGALGMLAIGAGGLEVAMAIAGHPLYLKMPKIWGVKLTGELPDWVSAKDIILEMLRRHNVEGGVGYIIEYYGPALKHLTAMDRHVIANMGAELGATTTVFPSDDMTKIFLESQGRGNDWKALVADHDATYDRLDEIDLSTLVPLIACPSSPGNVVPVSEVAGAPIYQAYIGSSANPGYRDFAICAEMVSGRQIKLGVSFDINPSSRNILEELTRDGYLGKLIHAGARIHQAGCNGCIGMGQAPATGRNSLRTVPRNFPGRSGTKEDSIFLCSPETATASALRGVITDPRDMDMPYPKIKLPQVTIRNSECMGQPLPQDQAKTVPLIKGPNIVSLSLPTIEKFADKYVLPVLLKLGDDISTDAISPAGAQALPFRSNIPKISEFVFKNTDETYPARAKKIKDTGGHIIIAGHNYGQGSSREHAALAPLFLGLQCVIAKSFARIHWQNLINFGILPVTFVDENAYDFIAQDDVIEINHLEELAKNNTLDAEVKGKPCKFKVQHELSPRQIQILLAGGLINFVKNKNK